MRVSSFAVARPAYYDRNAASNYNVYNATVGPHNFTERFLYTVAAGKKLLVEIANVEMNRLTVATVSGSYYARITGGSGYINTILDNATTVNASKVNIVAGAVTIYAGESVGGYTSDGSTGGTVAFYIFTKGTLFDA
jgi:hypothetical protein